jgi:hypothetical protein
LTVCPVFVRMNVTESFCGNRVVSGAIPYLLMGVAVLTLRSSFGLCSRLDIDRDGRTASAEFRGSDACSSTITGADVRSPPELTGLMESCDGLRYFRVLLKAFRREVTAGGLAFDVVARGDSGDRLRPRREARLDGGALSGGER